MLYSVQYCTSTRLQLLMLYWYRVLVEVEPFGFLATMPRLFCVVVSTIPPDHVEPVVATLAVGMAGPRTH